MDNNSAYSTDLGEANHHVAWTFGKLRFLSCLTKEQLRRDSLWEDLEQELKTTAYDAWLKNLSRQETWRYASRRIHAFLLAYGYRPYRGGYVRQENTFAETLADWQVANLSDRDSPPRNSYDDGGELREAILRNLRKHPQGMTSRILSGCVMVPARELHLNLDALIKEGKVTEVKTEAWQGHAPTLYFIAGARIPEVKKVHTERYERIRQAYQEGKSLNWIVHKYHHSFKTIHKAIRMAPAPISPTVPEKELIPA